MKRMDKPLMDHLFHSEESIWVLDVLARLGWEGDIQTILDAQEFISLPSFLTQFAKSQYEAGSQLLTAGEGGISS